MSNINQINLSTLSFVGSFRNNMSFASGIIFPRTEVSGVSSYTVKGTDFLLGCSFPTGTSGVIILPNDIINTVIIKDESGTAGISNIRISGFPNIEGNASILLNGSGAAITAYPTQYGWRIY